MLSSASSQLALILFAEAVSSREEVPAPFLIHVPHIGLLPGVVALVLVDQVHQEEQVVGQVVLLPHMSFKPMRHLVQIIFTDAANEAVASKLVLNSLKLVTKSTEGVNDETLDDGEQDERDEEEGEVKEDSDVLVLRAIWGLNDVTDTAASSDALVQMEHKAGEHIVTLLVRVLTLLALGHIEFPEEVEGQDGVDVAD